jgi:hypothetical protein
MDEENMTSMRSSVQAEKGQMKKATAIARGKRDRRIA